MTKHIHIYLGTSTKDDVKHAPAGTSAGGQFTSGGGGGGSAAKKTTPLPSKLAGALLKQESKVASTPKPTNSPAAASNWSASHHDKIQQAAETAMEDAHDTPGGHQKAAAAIKAAIASTEIAIKSGSPKYKGERKKELQRLQSRLKDHQK